MTGGNKRPDLADELQRSRERRDALKLVRPAGHAEVPWALCLSGGGIRSATFCLGVLQGLAKSPPPVPHPHLSSMLAQFDYLSTVSGGGYVGAFFSSLFVRGRLSGDTNESDTTAAKRAYEALLDEPPERMNAATAYDPHRPGFAALAWLRDNGRYLTPSGSGDLLYAAAIGLRNWFATHYVVATLTLLVLSLSLLLRLALSIADADAVIEAVLRRERGEWVWWSASWFAVAAVLLLVAVPFGIGFWFTHPGASGRVSDSPQPLTLAAVTAAVLAFAASVLGANCVFAPGDAPLWAVVLLAVGLLTLLGVAYFGVMALVHATGSITTLRVGMTSTLSLSLTAALALAALACVETLAQTAASWWIDRATLLPAGGVVAMLVWVTRSVAQRMSEKPAIGSWWSKLPLSVLAGLLGLVLWMLVAALLDLVLLWVVADGDPSRPSIFARPADEGIALLCLAACVGAALVVLACISGQFPGFLNLSTFQGLYSARLTRAYLGASNHKRHASNAAGTVRNVAESVPGDNLDVDALHANRAAPLHYINVCVNQTVAPGSQLVQRDRKGVPMVIAPHGFYLDGTAAPMPMIASNKTSQTELDSPLTVGEWVGVSGAAFTTGLGRSTSLGTSLLLGFANVRLGRWWRSGVEAKHARKPSWLRRVLHTQLYLVDEISARFYGTRFPYQYLSDGGHFENTAAYEMLRPARGVKLIVVCDCGADPDYRFDDLANLMRLARIDHGVELVVNRDVAAHPLLGRRFGTPESFTRGADGRLPAPSERCAVLLDVRSASGVLKARVVLLKPALLGATSADVVNYQRSHAAFPQESTADQFFDEAQWESYRKLGVELAQRVFPQGHDAAYDQAFWQAVLV